MQIVLPATPTARTAGRRRAVGRGAALDGAIVLCLFTLSFWHYLQQVDAPTYHIDEPRWIYRARLLADLRDPLGPAWDDATYRNRLFGDERAILRHQPPLGYFVLGLGILAQGRDLGTHGFYTFSRDDEWNRLNNRVPPYATFLAARRTNALLGILTVVALYAVAKRLANRVAGVAAALVLLPHPIQTYLASTALSDQLFVLLIVLAALAALRLADRPTWPRALLLGALLGLGGATKLSPLLVSLPLAAFGSLLLLPGRAIGPLRFPLFGVTDPAGARRLGLRLLPVPLVAALTFLASYPYLWPDPIGHTRALFDFRVGAMATQRDMFPRAHIDGPLDALHTVADTLTHGGTTTAWLADTLDLDRRYSLDRRYGLSWQGHAWELTLGLLGGAILAITAIRRGIASPHALAALLLGAQLAAIVAGLRIDFWGYYHPFVVALALGIGIAAGTTWVALRRAVRSALAARAAPATAPSSGRATGGREPGVGADPDPRPPRRRRRKSRRGGSRTTRPARSGEHPRSLLSGAILAPFWPGPLPPCGAPIPRLGALGRIGSLADRAEKDLPVSPENARSVDRWGWAGLLRHRARLWKAAVDKPAVGRRGPSYTPAASCRGCKTRRCGRWPRRRGPRSTTVRSSGAGRGCRTRDTGRRWRDLTARKARRDRRSGRQRAAHAKGS